MRLPTNSVVQEKRESDYTNELCTSLEFARFGTPPSYYSQSVVDQYTQVHALCGSGTFGTVSNDLILWDANSKRPQFVLVVGPGTWVCGLIGLNPLGLTASPYRGLIDPKKWNKT